MTENPHDKEDLEKETDETDEKSSIVEDQKKRSYYYDDACGYEIYNADDEETDDD
jgi:hypothetical protein